MKRESPAPPSRTALEELLDAEAEIAALSAAADRGLEEMRAADEKEAAERARAAALELERELAGADERAREERVALLRSLEAEASQLAGRYRSLSAADVARLARRAAAEAIGLPPEAPP